MGAALGGASAQVFGGRGAGTFLSKFTTVAAIIFFCTSLTLSMLGSDNQSVIKGALQKEAPAAVETTPAPAAEAAPEAAPAAEAAPEAAPAAEAAPEAEAAPAKEAEAAPAAE